MTYPQNLDVGFCFYETSLGTVQRAIESVRNHVRYIYAIDGKFEFFESENELSSEEVRDYLMSVPNVILVDYPNRKENEKRGAYLDLAKENLSDWLLILDADEYITDETDWNLTYKGLEERFNCEKMPEIFGVMLRPYQGKKKELSYPRLWKCPYLIEYMNTHNFWRYKTDGRVFRSSTSWPFVPGIFMKGDDKNRSKEYLEKSYDYQIKLMAYEKPYKVNYRKIAENTAPSKQVARIPGVPLT